MIGHFSTRLSHHHRVNSVCVIESGPIVAFVGHLLTTTSASYMKDDNGGGKLCNLSLAGHRQKSETLCYFWCKRQNFKLLRPISTENPQTMTAFPPGRAQYNRVTREACLKMPSRPLPFWKKRRKQEPYLVQACWQHCLLVCYLEGSEEKQLLVEGK